MIAARINYLYKIKWFVIICAKSATCLGQQSCTDKIQSIYFLLSNSRSNCDKLEGIPILTCNFLVVLNLCIFFQKGNICDMSDSFPIYSCYSHHFNPKLRRHNACVLRADLKFSNTPYHTGVYLCFR